MEGINLICTNCGTANDDNSLQCKDCKSDLMQNPKSVLSANEDFVQYTFKRKTDYDIALSTITDPDGLNYTIDGGNILQLNIIYKFMIIVFVLGGFIVVVITSLLDYANFVKYLGMILFMAVLVGGFYLFEYFMEIRDKNRILTDNNEIIGEIKNNFSPLRMIFLTRGNTWSFNDGNGQKIYLVKFKNKLNGEITTFKEKYEIKVNKNKNAKRYYGKIIEIKALGTMTKQSIILLNKFNPKTGRLSFVINPKELEIFAEKEVDIRLIIFFVTICIKKYFTGHQPVASGV